MKRTLFALPFVFAPSIGEAQSDSTSDSTRAKLPTVTVTATRGPAKSTYATPLAVTLIPKSQFEDKRGYSLDEAVSAVPGVLAQSRYGTSDIRLNIRGFGARGAGDRSNAGTSRGIRVLIDGIPETEPDGRTAFDLVDLAAAEAIEVVRSNASALYGNAGGGVVSISTVPLITAPFLRATQMAGGYEFLRSEVRAGTPLGPATLGFTFTNTSQQGYRAHSDSRRALFNVSLTSPVGSSTDVGVFVAAANDLFHIPGPLSFDDAMENPKAANSTYAARDERRRNRLARIGVTLDHELSESSGFSSMLFVNPKYLQRSERGTFRDFNRHHLGGNFVYRNGYSLSPAISASTVVGVDGAIQDGAILFYSLSADNGRGTELRDNKGEGAINTGVFAQQQLQFGERIGLDVGARWDRIRYDYRSHLDPRLDDMKDFSRVSPRLGLNYKFAPTHSVYFAVGGGVEAPAGNETDPASTFGQDTVTALNPLLEPIHSTTYEVGTKHLMSIGTGVLSAFSYEVALYDTRVTNEIVPYRGGRFYFTAGRADRRGVEIGASLFGRGDAVISGSLTASRNKYLEYTVDSVHYGRPGSIADYSDNDIAGIPSVFYNLSASTGIRRDIPLRFQVSVRGVGDYIVDDANTVEVPAYHIFGATVSTGDGIAIGRLSLRAWAGVENLTDKRYIGSAFINPDVVNGVPLAFEPGAGRTLTLALSLGIRR
ncbi:MAG TPA: TonB-dependent receptor [Gemmatimonadaceae bacterium]|nr:TonB-dependent receptor [Gemmatimonadaceae bacterium]